jgi:hypothetical protein
METTQELLNLDKRSSFFTVDHHGHAYKCYENYYFLWWSFKYNNGANFWGYVGTNTEPLCEEPCNFVQCHILQIIKLVK